MAVQAMDARDGADAEAIADLRGIHMKLGNGAAQGVPVHAKLFGGFALIAAMRGEHFENEPLFELADGFIVGDTTGVHLADQAVQLAFHKVLFLG